MHIRFSEEPTSIHWWLENLPSRTVCFTRSHSRRYPLLIDHQQRSRWAYTSHGHSSDWALLLALHQETAVSEIFSKIGRSGFPSRRRLRTSCIFGFNNQVEDKNFETGDRAKSSVDSLFSSINFGPWDVSLQISEHWALFADLESAPRRTWWTRSFRKSLVRGSAVSGRGVEEWMWKFCWPVDCS